MFRIYDGREHFYQWDINRKLIVDDNSITEVHFCNKTDTCSLVCEVYKEDGNNIVNVPNILLQSSFCVNVYAYDGEATKHSRVFVVKPRTKPADYVYTETEVKNYDTLKKYIDESIANIITPSGNNNCVVSKYYSVDMTTFRNYGVLDFAIAMSGDTVDATISTVLMVVENGVVQPLTDIPFEFFVGSSSACVVNVADFKSVGMISPLFEQFGVMGYLSFDELLKLLGTNRINKSTLTTQYTDNKMDFISLNIGLSLDCELPAVADYNYSLFETVFNSPDTKLVFEYQKQENIETHEASYQLAAAPIINIEV